MFKHIIVGFDGSNGAEAALSAAAKLAVTCEAELSVVTVFRHHSYLEASFSMVRPDDPGNMDDVMRSHAREVAEQGKTVAREAGATKARAFVKPGQPARSIIAFAEMHDGDLIVVGSRGLGSIEGYLVGSVSHKITGLADCPVLVV